MKYFFTLLITTIFCHILQNPVIAQVSYTTSHEVEYFLRSESETEVTHKIKVKVRDKTSGIQQIIFKEPAENIKNLEIIQSTGYYTVSNEGAKVVITFNRFVVGPADVEFTYKYNTDSLFEKIGSTFVLNVPRVEEETNIEKFTLRIYFPDNLKYNTNLQNLSIDSKGKHVTLTTDDLKRSGNSITLGEEMYYEIGIEHLVDRNKNYLIPIPNIIDRQEVAIKEISEKPDYTSLDKDGNLLFYYNLVDNPKLIRIKYLVRVYGNKTEKKEKFDGYLKIAVKNWDYNKGLPDYYVTNFNSQSSIEQKVYQSYNYVLDYLSYDNSKTNYDSINRIGAEGINEQNKNNAVCLEYSDLLISLLRGVGVAAREVNGITIKSDLEHEITQLHSWVEYLDEDNNWVQIDPTWGDTSNQDYLTNFDLYHVNFLRRGEDSENPILSGSYGFLGKIKFAPNKDIKPQLGEKIDLRTIEPPTKLTAEVLETSLGPIKLFRNPTPMQIYSKDLDLKPYSTIIIFSNKQGATSYEFNDLKIMSIDVKKVSLFNFFHSLNAGIIIFVILSPALFILLHVLLRKKVKKKIEEMRNRVRSII